jgi:hypothetical protein
MFLEKAIKPERCPVKITGSFPKIAYTKIRNEPAKLNDQKTIAGRKRCNPLNIGFLLALSVRIIFKVNILTFPWIQKQTEYKDVIIKYITHISFLLYVLKTDNYR